MLMFFVMEIKMYPEYIEINNKQYKINTDYKYALACFKALEDEEINDIARAESIIVILLGKEKENELIVPYFQGEELTKVLELLIKYLGCNTEEKNNNEYNKDMDFVQDEKYIYASFMSDYNIDLENTDMHWWKFCNLLAGLTEKCILNKVRDIRNTDLSDYKDEKTKSKLKKAMEAVKLKEKKTKEQQNAIDEFNNLFN